MYKSNDIKLFSLIVLSLFFLGLNSIFCKVAIANGYMDAYSFTFFRLFFASLTLVSIYFFKYKKIQFSKKENWITSFMLFLYAISFSYAYLGIDAGFGTLLLFGVVQLVMAFSSFFYKENLSIQKILGILIALFGLIYLLYPSETFEVSFFHSFLMIIAGLAWAVYTVLGKKSTNALESTMDNFLKATIFIVLFYFIFNVNSLTYSWQGLFFAFVSGSITSAIGYVIWYEVLPNMQIITAGIIQLFVPIISIVISVIFLDELLTINLLVSTLLICIGVLLTIFSKKITS